MKKFDKALKEIAAGVKDAMYDAIADDMSRCSYEYDFGNTTIMVEVEVVGSFMAVVIPDVWVDREDTTHNSPRVIDAVKNILPDWWAVTQEVELARWEERENEKFLMAQMY